MWTLLVDETAIITLQTGWPETERFYLMQLVAILIAIPPGYLIFKRWVQPKTLRRREEVLRQIAEEQAHQSALRAHMAAMSREADRRAAIREAAEREAMREAIWEAEQKRERMAERARQAAEQEAIKIKRQAEEDVRRADEDLRRIRHLGPEDGYWLPD
ncbi:hypothetical protein ACFQ11_09215 [Actinomadura sediminis]|uniref:Uncharacterized protein n=2 Tax=Actinomadura sediminis TaxID=1038904 RepID=A0ABW3EK59_9ACTN